MTYPVIAKGSKVGMHGIVPGQMIPLVRQAKERGLVWPLVKAVDNAGVALDVKQIEPRTLTITRFVNERHDAAQDVRFWTAEQRQANARAVIEFALGRLNPQERAAADWIEPLNEADPPGVIGWRAFGQYLCEIVRQADAEGLKLALPAFNAGTPEWDEMEALVATGLFGLMKRGGHILSAHEGVFGLDAVQLGFGDLIPGAPFVDGAGSLCFRYRYLYYLLQARGEVVPLVISEFYGGGGYPPAQSPADILRRFEWYDRGIRQDAFVLAVLPFTIDPGGWQHQDYTPAYQAVLEYLAREKDLANNVQYPEVKPIYPPGTTHVVANCSLLNVRQFPWTGPRVPPVVRQIPLGNPVRAAGLYQTAAMTHGWMALSPSSDEWVRADYLRAVG